MKAKILIASLILLASCSAEKTYKIGVSQCGTGQWRDKVNKEMLAAQHVYDESAKVSIACAYDDTELQIRQIDSLAGSGIDLLVVAPNEAAPIADAIAKVRQRGIPVIYFDRKATNDDYTAFIGGSNEEVGRVMGRYALSLDLRDSRKEEGNSRNVECGMWNEKCAKRVMEITGSMSSSPAQERHVGFASVMAEHPEVSYVCKEADWTSDKACSIVEEEVKSGKCPDIVFCHNDGMATGVYKAVVELGIEGRIKIIGIDGLPGEGIEYVQFGHQEGSYVYPTHGHKIIRLALDILTGKPYERENILQGMLVTPENANIVDLNIRELMEQSEGLISIQDKLENSLVHYDTQRKILIGSLVAIIVLIIAVIIACRGWLQTRKAIRQRQALNEEQTLFYTDASNRKLREIFVKPEDELPPPRSQDMLFAEQLNEAIRKNMSNPNLKMDELGEQLGLSRVQLYRKVKAITGQTPVELLRQMRLQKAYALLTSTTKNVAEIAYEVGFGTPGYFSTCFKKQFGKYPTDLRAE